MLNKRVKTLLVIFILLLVITSRINRLINSKIAQPPASETGVKENANFAPDVSTIPNNPLTPDDPAKYGIVVQKQEDLPRNQTQWDLHMKKVLVQSKALESMEGKKAFDGVKKTPQEFQQRVQLIDERIKNYEKMVQDDPSNESAQEKLQTLYMLKSTLTVMQDKIIADGKRNN